MTSSDPELYLRELSERELLKRESQNRGMRGSPLSQAAGALLAAGAIELDVARRVIDDDMLARELRGDGSQLHRRHRFLPGRHRPLERRSAAALGQTIELENGTLTLHEILFGRRTGTLTYSWRAGVTGHGRRRGASRRFGSPTAGMPWAGAAPAIADASGNRPTVTAGSGGGSDDQWEGELVLDGRLDPDSPWLTFDGARLDLDHRTSLLSVEIEPLDPEPAIERHLWRQLTGNERPFGSGADPATALEALITLGLLTDSDPFVAQLRAVAAAMPDHPRHPQHGPGRPRGARRLPEPWRSLLARSGRDDGPFRRLLVAATTPVFDGMQVGVQTVVSDATGFTVQCEVSPGMFGGAPLGSLPVGWWARDDRGNHYLGGPSGWGGDSDHSEGAMRYWPPLDPRAGRLELTPTGVAHRAAIAISLEQPAPEAVG